MTAFRARTIDSSRTLGDRLRAHRERMGTTLEAATQATGVSVKYLIALEESAYGRLPGDVYARNFLRKYATFLELDADDVLAQYESEHGIVRTLVDQGPRFIQRHIDVKPLFTPHRLRRGAFVLAVLAVLGYLVWQAWSIVRPPELIIETPPPQLTTTERSIEVRGRTDRESDLTINGQQVLADGNGVFSEQVDLQPGLNTIRISATRKRSKPQVVFRQVLVLADSSESPAPN